MKLHDSAFSGNAYKIHLFLALLGLDYETETVDLKAGGNRTEAFLRRNPRGQVPVLEDDGLIIWDSQAILVYIARRYGGTDWLPTDAAPMAEVMQWMAVAENECLYGLAGARAVKRFGRSWDLEWCQTLGRAGLDVLEGRLKERDWLALDRPTIADLACYPYVALAPEGSISLDDFPNVGRWIGRVQSLPGYVGMAGIQPRS